MIYEAANWMWVCLENIPKTSDDSRRHRRSLPRADGEVQGRGQTELGETADAFEKWRLVGVASSCISEGNELAELTVVFDTQNWVTRQFAHRRYTHVRQAGRWPRGMYTNRATEG